VVGGGWSGCGLTAAAQPSATSGSSRPALARLSTICPSLSTIATARRPLEHGVLLNAVPLVQHTRLSLAKTELQRLANGDIVEASTIQWYSSPSTPGRCSRWQQHWCPGHAAESVISSATSVPPPLCGGRRTSGEDRATLGHTRERTSPSRQDAAHCHANASPNRSCRTQKLTSAIMADWPLVGHQWGFHTARHAASLSLSVFHVAHRCRCVRRCARPAISAMTRPCLWP
jgi:hypothetical protein